MRPARAASPLARRRPPRRCVRGASATRHNPGTAMRDSTDLPVGLPVPGWTPRPRPPREPMVGRWCTLEPLDAARHARPLFEATLLDETQANWTYLSIG